MTEHEHIHKDQHGEHANPADTMHQVEGGHHGPPPETKPAARTKSSPKRGPKE